MQHYLSSNETTREVTLRAKVANGSEITFRVISQNGENSYTCQGEVVSLKLINSTWHAIDVHGNQHPIVYCKGVIGGINFTPPLPKAFLDEHYIVITKDGRKFKAVIEAKRDNLYYCEGDINIITFRNNSFFSEINGIIEEVILIKEHEKGMNFLGVIKN